MRNRNRCFLALCAILCAPCAAALVDDSIVNACSLSCAVAYAQDDEDPFAEDPFGSDDAAADEDSADVAEDDAQDAASAPSAANDDADPFGAPAANDPFAPSKLPGVGLAEPKPNATKPGAKPGDAQNGEEAEGEGEDERAKYLRPEDVPDELKTEEDFYATCNAAERAILGQKPQTDVEWFSAAVRVARVGRPSFAKLLVEKALDAPSAAPKDAAAALDELGVGRATYFIANPTIGKVGADAYEKVYAVARQYWEDETSLRAAIARTETGATSERAAAIVAMRKGGAKAIALLIGDLLGSDDAKRKTAASLLPFFESDAVEASLVSARGAAPENASALVDYLGDQVDSRVGFELAAQYYGGDLDDALAESTTNALAKQYRDLPAAPEIANVVFQKALGYFKRTELFPNAVDGELARWIWNEKANAPERETVPVDVAYLEETARLAQLARKIGLNANALPQNATELAIVATAELEVYRAGLDSPADGLDAFNAAFPEVTIDELQRAVKYAMDARRFKAALIPILQLRELGDESLCYANGEPATIVQAATCADRRVRFAALETIAKWDPSKSYVGASRVASALEWFTTAKGERYAVVASPKLDETTKIARLLSQQGYKTLSATTGRDALLIAQNNADVEFVLAAATIGTPDARVVAQTMRSDVRTSDVPLMVGTDDAREETNANIKVGAEPNALVCPKPFNLESSSWAVQKLFEYAQTDQVASELRLAQSKKAARTLIVWSKKRANVYELEQMNELAKRWLATPALFDEGLECVANLKTAYAQLALVELVGDTRFDAQTRRKALDALDRQWSANGSLLRGPDVKKMYDRYNASEKEDAETQKILSDMLDRYEQATGAN